MTLLEERAVDVPLHRRLGLTDAELDAIHERLRRAPNDLELAMFSVMWSEHCSYKSSKRLLRTLPTAGSDVLAGPGENAGVVSIGDGLGVAFKIESHNHPSAVEPYQGAATGVGGILRDIVAMGARPVALLDALKFGWPDDRPTRRLVDGVVRGVGGYGNCVGVPTVGGELTFDPTYTGNPLVNVMCVGVVAVGGISRAIAPTPGSVAVLFGSATGRDGIGGASVLASANFDEGSAAMRPSVQIGDPFAGKLLIEATLELVEKGLCEGMQDLGAAGLTCATSEVAARGGTGIRVDLASVPLREQDMAPFEVMISESQERMLAIVAPEQVDAVIEVVTRWGLRGNVIGEITADGDVVIVDRGAEIARIPARALAIDVPEQLHEAAPPTRRRHAPAPGETPLAHDGLPERGMDPGAVLEALLGHPNLGSRAWVTTQYDQTVGTDTIEGCAHGAAVLRVKGTRKALVIATDSQAAVAVHDPALGAALAVAECARNVSITGARPLGLTNCLNFGDPNVPEAYWQLSESVRGLSEAASRLGIPVTGGNVSLYNESPLGRILPTAQIGVVGLLDDLDDLVRPQFAAEGDVVVLLGEAGPGMAGSAYERLGGSAPDDMAPTLDLVREAALQELLRVGATDRVLKSAQDISGGGLAFAIAECAIWSGLGADIQLQVPLAPAVSLFGESPSRVIVTIDPAQWNVLARLASSRGVAARRLGVVSGDRLRIRLVGVGATGAAEERGAGVADALDVAIDDLRRAWTLGLPRALGQVA